MTALLKKGLPLLLLLLIACGAAAAEPSRVMLTDFYGHEAAFDAMPHRVAAASGSLGEVWLRAGGSLIAATQDAITERALDLDENVTLVGTIKQPDLEVLLSLDPDFVILSADISSHQRLAETLQALSIPYGLFHEAYFEDYLSLLGQFCALTGRSDLYEQNGLQVQRQIGQILSGAPDMQDRTVLLLRAYSSGFKAKDSGNLAGTMLQDFGLQNVLDAYGSLLEDISMEEILRVDPDYIFVTTMGSDVEGALRNLEAQLCADPAWASLSAVRAGRFHVLPKELFHYKPNARWAEAYAYLLKLF